MLGGEGDGGVEMLLVRSLALALLVVALHGATSVGEEPTVTKERGSAEELLGKRAPFLTPPEEFADDLGGYRPVLQFYDGRWVKTPADWQKRREEILTLWHKTLGPWPPLIERPAITYLEKEHVENFTRQKVRIEVAPGLTTEAYLLVPDGEGDLPGLLARGGQGIPSLGVGPLRQAPAGQKKRSFPAVLTVFYGPEDAAGLVEKARGRHDFGYQLTKRGFVTLNIGNPGFYYPNKEKAQLQPLSFLAYVAANCHTLLSQLPEVDGERIGIVGHSFGGKWALFASCLYDKFACASWCDPGIVFDETRPNVNYWEPWYLGYEPGRERKPGVPSADNPRTGPYQWLIENGHDLVELHALMAPRPFLVSGGSEDPPGRWKALNHAVAVNKLLGYERRVGMTNRPTHGPTPEAVEQMGLFFEYFLKLAH
jgi:hypothetical protein